MSISRSQGHARSGGHLPEQLLLKGRVLVRELLAEEAKRGSEFRLRHEYPTPYCESSEISLASVTGCMD